MTLVETIPLLEVNREILEIAQVYQVRGLMPKSPSADALHLALASFYRMDFLLTWNCKHIANAEMRVKIDKACRDQGVSAPIICTHEELSGG